MPRVKILTDSSADHAARGGAENLASPCCRSRFNWGKKYCVTAWISHLKILRNACRANPRRHAPRPFAKSNSMKLYTELTKGGGEVVSIHLSSKLSQTYRNAQRAAAPLLGRSKIIVIDSQLITVGLGMFVTAAGAPPQPANRSKRW